MPLSVIQILLMGDHRHWIGGAWGRNQRDKFHVKYTMNGRKVFLGIFEVPLRYLIERDCPGRDHLPAYSEVLSLKSGQCWLFRTVSCAFFAHGQARKPVCNDRQWASDLWSLRPHWCHWSLHGQTSAHANSVQLHRAHCRIEAYVFTMDYPASHMTEDCTGGSEGDLNGWSHITMMKSAR